MNTLQTSANREQTVSVQNGWMMLALVFAIVLVNAGILIMQALQGPLVVFFIGSLLLAALMMPGFFSLQPNEARVLVLFGKYKGTVRTSGFHWGNPFYSNGPQTMADAIAAQKAAKLMKTELRTTAPRSMGRYKISLRARTLNGDPLKVNDRRGNPIEIAAVVVWRVEDTAQAVFDIDDYEKFIWTQSESALRHLASLYSYDEGEPGEITLRSNVEEVSRALGTELRARLAKAGIAIDEARLTHLAYSPEIAQAMLRRQQAEAVISAREKIVHGAVSMVDMALRELAQKEVVHLDDERRAAMVSNLMVVLCGESEVHPVVNAGTLYA